MSQTGSGGVGFVVSTGPLVVIAAGVVALLAVGVWLMFRH